MDKKKESGWYLCTNSSSILLDLLVKEKKETLSNATHEYNGWTIIYFYK